MLRRLGWLIVGALGMLAAVEGLLRVLPTSTATLSGYYIDPLIITYPPGHRWQVSTGWDLRNAQQHRANSLGFSSDREYVPDARAVAVIGDSFVEASMLEPAYRAAEQLAAALQQSRPVYGMGMLGSAVLDYAERVCYAAKHLDVRDFVVVLEAGDVRQSLCGSNNVHGPCLDRQTLQASTELHAAPSLAKRIVRHSALAQYVLGQLKVDPQRLMEKAFKLAAPVEPARAERAPAPPKAALPTLPTPTQLRQVRAIVDAFLARTEPCVRGQLVLLVDGRRERDEPLVVASTQAREIRAERRAFIDMVRARNVRGVTVVDAEAVYRAHTSRSPLAIVVGPYDGHLNRIGIGLLMNAAASVLRGQPSDPPP